MPVYEADSVDNAKALLGNQQVRKIRLHFDIGCDEFFGLIDMAGDNARVLKVDGDLLIFRDPARTYSSRDT